MVNRIIILLHNGFATLAVSFLNRSLYFFNRLFARKNTTDGEERSLHDCIDATTHAGF